MSPNKITNIQILGHHLDRGRLTSSILAINLDVIVFATISRINKLDIITCTPKNPFKSNSSIIRTTRFILLATARHNNTRRRLFHFFTAARLRRYTGRRSLHNTAARFFFFDRGRTVLIAINGARRILGCCRGTRFLRALLARRRLALIGALLRARRIFGNFFTARTCVIAVITQLLALAGFRRNRRRGFIATCSKQG